jgi:diguanylate cyclase (GGDEF)-like protein/PAS domain S-box-containing protein
MHPDDVEPISAAYLELLHGQRDTYEVEKRYLHADGSLIWARLRVSAIRDDDGRLLFTVTMIDDVTAERLAAEAIAHSERRFRSAFHDLGTGMVLANVDGTLLEVNRSLCELLGHTNEELVGSNWLDTVHPEDLPMVVTAAYRLLDREVVSSASEHRALRRDGQEVWMISTASLLEEEGGSPVFLMQMQDITERKRAEAELSFDATHDQLTRLPNRVVVLDRLKVALGREREGRESVAVLFVDLDHFKLVNDSYGHDVGDEVLVALAARLGDTAGPDALVARFAGDEFIVLCESCPDAAYATGLADSLAAAIAEPLVVEAGEVQLTASIGIAFGHDEDFDPDLVLRDADLAMFEAKARGRARATVFDDALRGRARYRLETARALRLAIERTELVLHYQPVVDMRSGTMTGVEALVRWEHPDRGLISPGEFMPVAEETGLVVSLGAWVLDESCRQGAVWAADPAVGPIVVSVNLSARQFNDDALVPRVTRALQASGLPPRLLCLEITESAVMDDVDHTGEVLAQLRGLGVALSIDDFGTGYSSLSYLKQFPVDALKIDRSFVDGLGSESEDTQIVTAVVHLAHALGLTVVAEGVETTPQLEVLRNLGCERVQGYLIARPQPAADLIAWLHDRRAASARTAGGDRVAPHPSIASLAGRRDR